ncbi:hypothetical protein AYI68_g6248 [Smittium mucronatum]|uniref:Uncharacterized protein n=1 Tax=Smittium mucronatum TaxID=133383 RepID=A0A1R0GS30_9FUNG|nr:hypothetical protein AYI68_g6248 [Smittium mucronatum]
MIRRKDYPNSLDLQDAFMHILIHKKSSSPSAWAIPKSLDIQEDSQPSFRMVQIEKNEDIGISQTSELWENDIEMSGELYLESPVDDGGISPRNTNASSASGARQPLSFYTQFMDVDSDTE